MMHINSGSPQQCLAMSETLINVHGFCRTVHIKINKAPIIQRFQ